MKSVRVHPVTKLFPMMSEAELTGLADDIREHGLIRPIVLDAKGVLLDGRNRKRACELANVESRFETFKGDDPVSYILSTNARTRHMNESQRAMVAARLATLWTGTARSGKFAGYSQIQAAAMLNGASA